MHQETGSAQSALAVTVLVLTSDLQTSMTIYPYWLCSCFWYCLPDNILFILLHPSSLHGFCIAFRSGVIIVSSFPSVNKHLFQGVSRRAVNFKLSSPQESQHRSSIKCDGKSKDTFLDMTGLRMNKCSRKGNFNERFLTLFLTSIHLENLSAPFLGSSCRTRDMEIHGKNLEGRIILETWKSRQWRIITSQCILSESPNYFRSKYF